MITENINFRGAGKLPVHGVIWTPDDKRVEQVLHVIQNIPEDTRNSLLILLKGITLFV